VLILHRTRGKWRARVPEQTLESNQGGYRGNGQIRQAKARAEHSIKHPVGNFDTWSSRCAFECASQGDVGTPPPRAVNYDAPTVVGVPLVENLASFAIVGILCPVRTISNGTIRGSGTS